MCTYQTEKLQVRGSGKGPNGWFGIAQASVYFDHPVHYSAEHALNIDFLNPDMGAAARVAVELSPDTARSLARAILTALDNTPAELLELSS